MNLDWPSIDDFKLSGFKGEWQFKYLRSFIRYGTLDGNMPGILGVYMVILMSGSTLEFVVKRFQWILPEKEFERSNCAIEES